MGQKFPTAAERKALRQKLEKQIKSWRKLDTATPKGGWVRAMREALDMTGGQLARRTGMTVSNIGMSEQSEARGAIQLNTLTKLANALHCDVAYALVPRKNLDRIVLDAAVLTAAEDFKSFKGKVSTAGYQALVKAHARNLRGKRIWGGDDKRSANRVGGKSKTRTAYS